MRGLNLIKLLLIACTLLLVFCNDNAGAQLQIESGKIVVLTELEGYDKNICEASKKMAITKGCNPICAFLDKKGDMHFAKGSLVSIEKGKYAFKQKDMVINAGGKPLRVEGILLQKGEYAIVKNGKLEKQQDLLRK